MNRPPFFEGSNADRAEASHKFNRTASTALEHYNDACNMTLTELKKEIEFLKDTIGRADRIMIVTDFIRDMKTNLIIDEATLRYRTSSVNDRKLARELLNNILKAYHHGQEPLPPAPLIGNPNFQKPNEKAS